MKMKQLTTRKLCSMAVIACGALFFGSCADHYDGDESWSSPVRNATLQSPNEDDITIEPNSDGSQMTISWSVVYGAGGYEFQLFDANDETTPLVSDTIDGCKKTLAREEDMNYKIVIRALGNSELNNKEAATATVKSYSTFTKTYAAIPEGDLYAYFQSNPIPDDASEELNFDLKSGGTYTLSQPLGFNYHKVVIRTTDKNNHANIALAEGANFVVSNSFTLKYVDVDASSTIKPLMEAYKYEQTPDDILPKPKNYYLIEFVRILNCSITGIQGSLFYDNNLSYAVTNFIIKESVIEMATTTANIKNEAFVSFQGGGVKDFSCVNSTIFQTGEANSKYFLRYNNSIRIDRLGWDQSIDHTTLTYTNNTFYKVANGQWANYSGINNYTIYNLQNNIWYDCADGQIARRMKGNGRLGNNCSWTSANNTYWYNGAKADQSDHDTSTSILETDPAFEDPENGDFTPTGADQVAKQTGDPRWYTTE
jgi:hypothetical protein